MVEKPLGSIKKRLQKTVEKTGQHFFRLDQAINKRKALKKEGKKQEAIIDWEAQMIMRGITEYSDTDSEQDQEWEIKSSI